MEEERNNTEFKNIQSFAKTLVTNIRYEVTEVFIVEHAIYAIVEWVRRVNFSPNRFDFHCYKFLWIYVARWYQDPQKDG